MVMITMITTNIAKVITVVKYLFTIAGPWKQPLKGAITRPSALVQRLSLSYFTYWYVWFCDLYKCINKH